MDRIIPACLSSMLFVAHAVNAGAAAETSVVEEHGTRITFSPACIDGDIYLRGSIRNISAKPLRLDPALVPWGPDPISTKFVVEYDGTPLKFGGVFPTLNVTPPIVLNPGEQREGVTPIAHMFPDIRNALTKGSVTIRWTYPMPLAASKPVPVSGALVLSKNPCLPRD